MEQSQISVSTITPVYSGAKYLESLVDALVEVRDRWARSGSPLILAEAIFVDDAAIDESPGILEELARQHAWITVIHLARNFGQHAATIAGTLHCSGDWVVTLDEDLQHPPKGIEPMLRKAVLEGLDLVYAQPVAGVHQTLHRDLSSRLYKRLMSMATGNKNIALFNSFRLIRGTVARAASSVCGHETYFDMALSWFTNRVGAFPIMLKDRRTTGGSRSGYSLLKLLSHARRLFVSTHIKFLRLGAAIGFAVLVASFSFATYLIFKGLLVPDAFEIRGWASLMVVTLFLGGVTVSLTSVLLEYGAVILLHSQGKPSFFVVDRASDEELARYFRAIEAGPGKPEGRNDGMTE
jgi:polyisoprenyl-phosphate glycosyltransferase